MDAWLTTDEIGAADVLDRVGSPADGAVLLFLGTVRDQNQGRPVSGMRYEAYAEMATRVLRAIAAEAAERCGGRVAVVHRTGELRVGDVSVAIAVSTPHREAAFDGARYVIEQIKVRLPVWKHEHYTTGEARWLDGVAPEGKGR